MNVSSVSTRSVAMKLPDEPVISPRDGYCKNLNAFVQLCDRLKKLSQVQFFIEPAVGSSSAEIIPVQAKQLSGTDSVSLGQLTKVAFETARAIIAKVGAFSNIIGMHPDSRTQILSRDMMELYFPNFEKLFRQAVDEALTALPAIKTLTATREFKALDYQKNLNKKIRGCLAQSKTQRLSLIEILAKQQSDVITKAFELVGVNTLESRVSITPEKLRKHNLTHEQWKRIASSFDCTKYAFYRLEDPMFDDIVYNEKAGLELPIDLLSAHYKCVKVPEKGALVLYVDANDIVQHTGYLETADLVASKWGEQLPHIFLHSLDGSLYGNKYYFYVKK